MERNNMSAQGAPDANVLIDVVRTRMPYGKYKDRFVCDLPVSYLEWLQRNGGFPKGKMGMLLATIYEIKINGLNYLLDPLKPKR
jgi:uncharacterized protein (DUF3820 family)